MNIRDLILELIEEGVFDHHNITLALLKYLSEDDIIDCLRYNELHHHIIDRISNESN